jgi:hypothetical protein
LLAFVFSSLKVVWLPFATLWLLASSDPDPEHPRVVSLPRIPFSPVEVLADGSSVRPYVRLSFRRHSGLTVNLNSNITGIHSIP